MKLLGLMSVLLLVSCGREDEGPLGGGTRERATLSNPSMATEATEATEAVEVVVINDESSEEEEEEVQLASLSDWGIEVISGEQCSEISDRDFWIDNIKPAAGDSFTFVQLPGRFIYSFNDGFILEQSNWVGSCTQEALERICNCSIN